MPSSHVPPLNLQKVDADELDQLMLLNANMCLTSPYQFPSAREPENHYATTTARAYSSRSEPGADLTAFAISQRQAKARKTPRKPLGGAMDGGYEFDWVTANAGAMIFDDEMQRYCTENQREFNFKRHAFSEYVEARAKNAALDSLGMGK